VSYPIGKILTVYVPKPSQPVAFAATASWISPSWIVQWTAMPWVVSVSAGRKMCRLYGAAFSLSHAVYSLLVALAVPKYLAAAAASPLTPWAKRQNKIEMDGNFILQFYETTTINSSRKTNQHLLRFRRSRQVDAEHQGTQQNLGATKRNLPPQYQRSHHRPTWVPGYTGPPALSSFFTAKIMSHPSRSCHGKRDDERLHVCNR
jgi:hypothetical protein